MAALPPLGNVYIETFRMHVHNLILPAKYNRKLARYVLRLTGLLCNDGNVGVFFARLL